MAGLDPIEGTEGLGPDVPEGGEEDGAGVVEVVGLQVEVEMLRAATAGRRGRGRAWPCRCVRFLLLVAHLAQSTCLANRAASPIEQGQQQQANVQARQSRLHVHFRQFRRSVDRPFLSFRLP